MLIALLVLAIAGTLGSSGYTVLALRAASHFKRERGRSARRSNTSEPLSVLKPVHGEGAGLEQNLLTFYQQQHPNFELLFSARTLTDPALEIVRRLARRFPEVPTRLIASGEPEWPNARAYSVNALIAEARYPTIVVTDSDVRVPPDFLQSVVTPLEEEGVGLATCLYRGVSLGGIWTDLEALGMSVELMSNVLIANMLNGMDFALGPATATTRERIDQIGGLAELGFYYADDFALGNLMHRTGLKVVLSDTVVEHVVPTSSFGESFRHQVLWLKNNRFLRPREHVGVGLTFAMPFTILGCVLGLAAEHRALAIFWLIWGVANCMTRSVAIGWRVIKDRKALTRCWLYPMRDSIGFATWIATWFGNKIVFRGEKYILLKGGKIQRLSSRA
ncbi:MAG: putative ceramide glucosyltransferase [Bryobacterales bacterium]|nr:putative ceramide glucosyltransferase [Bryobacterales bacterium]